MRAETLLPNTMSVMNSDKVVNSTYTWKLAFEHSNGIIDVQRNNGM